MVALPTTLKVAVVNCRLEQPNLYQPLLGCSVSSPAQFFSPAGNCLPGRRTPHHHCLFPQNGGPATFLPSSRKTGKTPCAASFSGFTSLSSSSGGECQPSSTFDAKRHSTSLTIYSRSEYQRCSFLVFNILLSTWSRTVYSLETCPISARSKIYISYSHHSETLTLSWFVEGRRETHFTMVLLRWTMLLHKRHWLLCRATSTWAENLGKYVASRLPSPLFIQSHRT